MAISERAQQIYKWQQERRKPNTSGYPIAGFGSGGEHTLWLQTPEPTTSLAIRDGRVTEVEMPGIGDHPELVSLREKIITGFRSIDEGLLSVPIELANYAALLIRLNYNVTDEELTMLLFGSGDFAWAEPMLIHAAGGPAFLDRFVSGCDVVRDLIISRRPSVLHYDPLEMPPGTAIPPEVSETRPPRGSGDAPKRPWWKWW